MPGESHQLLPWLGGEGMLGHYDQIKAEEAFRKDVANRRGVGFDIPAILGSIEPSVTPSYGVGIATETSME
jgi:hypothetical protein